MSDPYRYLSGAEAARRRGMTPSAWRALRSRGYTPDPDVMVGDVAGWLPETVDQWERPGQGFRSDKRDNAKLKATTSGASPIDTPRTVR